MRGASTGWGRAAMLAIGCAMSGAVLRPARAYEVARTSAGEPTRWRAPLVRYGAEVDAQIPALPAAARRAMDAWTAVEGAALVAEWVGPTARDAAVSFGPDALDEVHGALALTFVRYAAGTATITAARVALSREVTFGADPGDYDLDSVVVHEAGHALGLAHTCGDRGTAHPSCFDLDRLGARERAAILGAVMAPTLAVGDRRRALTDDDAAGLVALYPGDRGAAPFLGAVVRECPSGAWVLQVSPADRVRLSLRGQDGARTAIEPSSRAADRVVFDAPPGAWDVVAEDPQEGSRSALVSADPPPCAAPDAGVIDAAPMAPMPVEGCSVAGAPGALAWALVALLGWSRRSRR